MAKMTDAAQRWLASMTSGNATNNYKEGINSYTGNPMEKAAAAQDRYLAGVQDAVNSGRMKSALLATPVSAWKAAATGKGATRLSDGARAAMPKVQAHFQRWGPIYQQISDSIAAMPKGGLSNAVARMTAAYTMLKQGAGKSAA